MKNCRATFITLSFFLYMFIFPSCSYRPEEIATIRIKGSDTMLYLTKNLAEEYMRRFPGVSIYVEGGGTSPGIKALINGEVNISTASRTLKADEAKILAEQYGSLGVSFIIAKDALSIYVNADNPVKDFTIQQLKNIFTCRIKNWKELGGVNEPVIPITRSPNSGTYLYFREHVLENEEYCEDALIKSTTENIIEEIKENKNAIGYGGIGYGDKFIHAKINGIESTEENIRNDVYPISRYLHFYTLNTPEGKVKDFINWVMSPDGQKIVKLSGYIPLFEISF